MVKLVEMLGMQSSLTAKRKVRCVLPKKLVIN